MRYGGGPGSRNETSPVLGVHLLWPAPSCYEALEGFDEFLSCLVGQQLQVGGSRETTCKQQNVGFPDSSFLADLVGNWTGVIDDNYLEWN